jgi:hypothetical protein
MRFERRMGKFTISGYLQRTTDEHHFCFLQGIMYHTIVYHVEHRVDLDKITYYAYNPTFDVINEGDEYPEYEFVAIYKGSPFIDYETGKMEERIGYCWRRK